ncbi:MAG TPA: rod shape-determining protein MreC [Candidatus Paceibacterota bacterium]|jgi:cell shape-determining protein MreC|nr:rod shape-determining protein MreC [Candidatus Paceibacterota bacterium]HJN62619.1 rod shape-determining protein MreC [Candidatus Paceibacterota bacterium]
MVVALIFIFILVNLFIPNIIPGKFNSLGKPIWKLREGILEKFGEVGGVLHSKSSLVVENKRLRSELKSAELLNIKVNLLERENRELKNLSTRETVSGDLLRVLSKASQSPYDTLIIDIDNKKVSVGQEVFSEEEILIGVIDEIYKDSARVRLLSSAGNKYNVEIGDESIEGIAEGLGGGNFEITLPRGVDAEVGDEIISPDLAVKLLGIVEHIESKPQNSFQKILFKSPVNINQIKWVKTGND